MEDSDPLVDFGDATAGETPLEEKYRDFMRQIVSQKIELPISTLPLMIKNQINLAPEFQRRDRWDVAKQSRFIESIIMNVPIPPVFLGEDDYGNYVVLDGRQRLTALNEFMKGAYALRGLGVWADLNDLRFPDLEKKKLDKAITRRFVPAVVILKESSPEVKYDVFDRLNTGGEVALPMEIRNAVFPGPFRDLIHTLSDDTNFRKLWDIPVDDEQREKKALYKTMGDLELVLRFFATRDHHRMNLAFKDYLSDYMGKRNAEYGADAAARESDAADFDRAVRNSWTIFAEDAFRKPQTDRKSAPLADAIMVALSEVDPQLLSPSAVLAVKAAFTRLATENEEFKRAMGTGTNGKGAIKTRIELARSLVREVLQQSK